jgi:hypothetical protein
MELQSLLTSREERGMLVIDLYKNDYFKKCLIVYQVLRLGAVAHPCNPSYLGGRDREDCGFRAA